MVGVLQPQSRILRHHRQPHHAGDAGARQRDGAAHRLRQPRLDRAAQTHRRPCDRPTAVSATAFDLPANYKRMLLTSNVWRSTSTQHADDVHPRHRRVAATAALATHERRAWASGRCSAARSTSTRSLPVGDSRLLRLPRQELHRRWPAAASATAFMNDADSFRLDERLLKLGMIWQWKAHKGATYAEDMGTYGDALGYAMGHDSPAPIIIGRRPISRCRTAIPAQTLFRGRCRHEPAPSLPPLGSARAGRAAAADHDDPGADARHHPERERSLHAAGRLR